MLVEVPFARLRLRQSVLLCTCLQISILVVLLLIEQLLHLIKLISNGLLRHGQGLAQIGRYKWLFSGIPLICFVGAIGCKQLRFRFISARDLV